MNSIDVHDLLTTPLAMTALGFVIVVLMALTMNSVVKRERAMMVRALRHDSADRVAYLARWRNGTSA
ncbi:MAG: hypothetical protein AB7G47_17515 [Mycolicibacterium sp.]|uniref:hypothetical protein n=1 Tax=Mycolicibacterium sp. TaxID=2320850 RepID=UPI003D09BBDE